MGHARAGVYHDTVDITTPIAVPGKTFYTVRIPWNSDFKAFYEEARRIITSIPEDGDPYGTDKEIAAQGDFERHPAQCHAQAVLYLHLLHAVCPGPSAGLSADERG